MNYDGLISDYVIVPPLKKGPLCCANSFTTKSKIMIHNGYDFWGMHLVWWFVWGVFLFWIIAKPYDVPGQRKKKDTPLDILQHRFASGSITTEEYEEKKKILETDLVK